MPKRPETAFFEFFISLAANNHKTWFDENRRAYEQDVKLPFESLVQEIITAMAATDKRLLLVKPADCIFRINRDIRFSKDKTPYKLNRSAIIGPGGRKDMDAEGFYIEIGPESCGFYAGSYMPEKPLLQAIRNKIAAEPDRWKKITGDAAFKKTFGRVLGEQQQRVPAELKDAAEQLPVIRNTQFYVKHEISPDDYLETDPVKHFISLWKVALPFIQFLSEAKGVSV